MSIKTICVWFFVVGCVLSVVGVIKKSAKQQNQKECEICKNLKFVRISNDLFRSMIQAGLYYVDRDDEPKSKDSLFIKITYKFDLIEDVLECYKVVEQAYDNYLVFQYVILGTNTKEYRKILKTYEEAKSNCLIFKNEQSIINNDKTRDFCEEVKNHLSNIINENSEVIVTETKKSMKYVSNIEDDDRKIVNILKNI